MRKDHLVRTLCLGALALAVMESPVWAVPSSNVSPSTSNAMNGQIMIKDHKSGFEVTERLKKRNPFWPVGWVPGMRPKEKVVTTVFNPTEAFSITSILLGPPDLALINGKRYETGQVIPTVLGNQTLQIKIVRIQDGGVVMALGNKQFLVPKKRHNPDKAK